MFDIPERASVRHEWDVDIPVEGTDWQIGLTRLPTTPAGQLGNLLPDHWRAAPTTTDLTPAPAVAAGSASPPHAESSP
jgi:hypothetical protein